MIKKIFLNVILLTVIASTFLTTTLSFPIVNAEECDTMGVYIEDDYYEFLITKGTDDRQVYVKDNNGNFVYGISVEDDVIYEINVNTGAKEKISSIENFEEESMDSVQTLAVEPNWGPLISQRKRVTIPGNSTAVSITALLASACFPGASIPIGVLSIIAEYLVDNDTRYIDETIYFNEAIGCPQYRWFKKQEYRNPSGKIIRTVSLNKKSFLGVTHSPQNPPACSLYGF